MTARLEFWWRNAQKKYKCRRCYIKCSPAWKEYKLKVRMPEKSKLWQIENDTFRVVIGVKKGGLLWIDQVRVSLNEDLDIQSQKSKK